MPVPGALCSATALIVFLMFSAVQGGKGQEYYDTFDGFEKMGVDIPVQGNQAPLSLALSEDGTSLLMSRDYFTNFDARTGLYDSTSVADIFKKNGDGSWTVARSWNLPMFQPSGIMRDSIVRMSADGNTLAFFSVAEGNQVIILKFNGSAWLPMGGPILHTQSEFETKVGWTVQISGDGKTVFVANRIRNSDSTEPTNVPGDEVNPYVEQLVYRWNENLAPPNWQMISHIPRLVGDGLPGEVVMSHDGSLIVCPSALPSIRLPVYRVLRQGSNHTVETAYILQEYSSLHMSYNCFINSGYALGGSIDISADGSMIAVGARSVACGLRGWVEVFQYDEGSWKKYGEMLSPGTTGDGFGSSVQVFSAAESASGYATIAVGAKAAPAHIYTGYVYLFQNIEGEWVQHGQTIRGNKSDSIGERVLMSRNGILAILSHSSYNNATNRVIYLRIVDGTKVARPPMINTANQSVVVDSSTVRNVIQVSVPGKSMKTALSMPQVQFTAASGDDAVATTIDLAITNVDPVAKPLGTPSMKFGSPEVVVSVGSKIAQGMVGAMPVNVSIPLFNILAADSASGRYRIKCAVFNDVTMQWDDSLVSSSNYGDGVLNCTILSAAWSAAFQPPTSARRLRQTSAPGTVDVSTVGVLEEITKQSTSTLWILLISVLAVVVFIAGAGVTASVFITGEVCGLCRNACQSVWHSQARRPTGSAEYNALLAPSLASLWTQPKMREMSVQHPNQHC